MDLQIKGKLAVVTGSTAGIGLAIAEALAKEGAHVIINGRFPERVKAAAEEIRRAVPNSGLSTVAADLSTAEGIGNMVTAFPEVDILVNNLGIFEAIPFTDITDEHWERIWQANVLSGVRLSRAYFPHMLRNNWGRIIFISSESAVNIPAEMIHYGVTKTAQVALARGLAELTVGTGVTVNTVLPGPTKSEGVTRFVDDLGRAQQKSAGEVEKEFFQTMRPSSLLKRFERPDEIANLVTYLCSPLASATNGAAVRADGGVVRSIL